jgi:organic hydroperoxide reductase OsmC/OhrA
MIISAHVSNREGHHKVSLTKDRKDQSLQIPPKAEGLGSSVSGGELLFLALATCYCNDIYKEAKKRGMSVRNVEVDVQGEFGSEGGGAKNISYRASVAAKATQDEILDLIRHTDKVAEIHSTVRNGSPVVLSQADAIEV